MRIFEQGTDRDEDILHALTAGSALEYPSIEVFVREIIERVHSQGDSAVLELGRRFDSEKLTTIAVSESEIRQAASSVPQSVLSSLLRSADNIRAFHEREKQSSWFHSSNGAMLGQIVQPIDSVGIYVPGGRASYPSTVLMTAIPAAVAGVSSVAVATPCGPDGDIPPVVLAACELCGVSKVYKMGGAQAIAAFAFGTESVTKVDKVVGPGNQYVNVAKRLLFGLIGIDSLAGPSEVLIVADTSCRAEWIASDLIAQAEHGADSKAILITWSRAVADKVLAVIPELLSGEPRADYIRQSLASRGAIVVVNEPEEALRWTNICAPEHLQLMVSDPVNWLGRIRSAGAVFVGPYSPATLGDYAAGPSHTLPTGASARFSSALGVAEFQKRSSLIWYSREAYEEDARCGMTLAQAEGLPAHETSLAIRLAADSA